jgi:hypothetical protein
MNRSPDTLAALERLKRQKRHDARRNAERKRLLSPSKVTRIDEANENVDYDQPSVPMLSRGGQLYHPSSNSFYGSFKPVVNTMKFKARRSPKKSARKAKKSARKTKKC